MEIFSYDYISELIDYVNCDNYMFMYMHEIQKNVTTWNEMSINEVKINNKDDDLCKNNNDDQVGINKIEIDIKGKENNNKNEISKKLILKLMKIIKKYYDSSFKRLSDYKSEIIKQKLFSVEIEEFYTEILKSYDLFDLKTQLKKLIHDDGFYGNNYDVQRKCYELLINIKNIFINNALRINLHLIGEKQKINDVGMISEQDKKLVIEKNIDIGQRNEINNGKKKSWADIVEEEEKDNKPIIPFVAEKQNEFFRQHRTYLNEYLIFRFHNRNYTHVVPAKEMHKNWNREFSKNLNRDEIKFKIEIKFLNDKQEEKIHFYWFIYDTKQSIIYCDTINNNQGYFITNEEEILCFNSGSLKQYVSIYLVDNVKEAI